jgi:hypothetical protein
MDRDTSALTHAGARVLDIGDGELLVRIKRAHPHVTTIGIEPAHRRAEAARENGVDEVREALLEDAAPDAGELDLVCCLASSHAISAWDTALVAMAGWTRPGGLGLVGEGFRARTPTPAYLEILGGATEDELPNHDGLLAGAADAGWTVEAEAVAAPEDWARYEETLVSSGDRALARSRWNHPDRRDTLLTLRR